MNTHSIIPDLKPGINLVVPPGRRTSALHRIVIGELLERDGVGYWIDARNTASTYVLHELAPSRRTLDPLRIARAFTAYQHHAIVRSLVRHVTGRTAFIVAPAIADLYRDDDIPAPEDDTYFAATLSTLEAIATTFEIPVITSEAGIDPFTERLAEHAVQEIAVESTPFGYRYVTDGFETTAYWQDGHWQTTIPYWVELFGRVEASDPTVAYDLGLVDAEV